MCKLILKFSIILLLVLNFIDFMNLKSCEAQWISGVLHSFNGTDGAISKGSLTLVGNTLFGRTSAGGPNGEGVIFKINNDSTDFQILYNFQSGSSNGLGKEPHHDAMLFYNDTLYGTALMGGLDDNGVIYKISTNGGGYTPMHVFNGSDTDGAQPHSGVIAVNNVFYGLTAEGGTHGNGTLYKINPDGSDFSVLFSFHNSVGDNSHGRLTLGSDGHKLFGMTKTGGSDGLGVVFYFNLNDSVYSVIHSFQGGHNDGSSTDHGFVTISSDTIFGMTQLGGANNEGVLFMIKEDGSHFQVLHSFGDSSEDGSSPYGSLQLSNGYLYGTTRQGGQHNHGTVFSIKTNGSNYQVIFSLKQNTSGEYPIDNVVLNNSGTELYCLSQAGGEFDSSGTNQYGTIFELNTLGSSDIKNISTEIPEAFYLSQNFPNPFNPVTNLEFGISKLGFVTLKIYDMLGKEAATLVNTILNPGTYKYQFDGSVLPSGIYFYTLKINKFSETRKMLLIK